MKTVCFFILLIFLSVLFIAFLYFQYLEFRFSEMKYITPEYPKLSSVYIEQNPWKPECEDGFKIAYSLNRKHDDKKEGVIYGPLESVWCVIE